MVTELKRRWLPGSLIFIDEPELHLHESLQSRLYNRIVDLQRERGGQAWMTTQSAHLFEVGETNSKLLLRGLLR
jgi:predicted ATP-dependent endonuclease of OLD family